MFDEVWKDIPGFEGYQLSNQGRFRSLNGRHTKGVWTYLAVVPSGPKHRLRPYIYICIKRKTYGFQLSRLLWEMFKGPIPEGMVIDHVDGNAFNNSFENLRCCSQTQNNQNKRLNPKGKTSLYKGVFFRKRENRWYAEIKVNKTAISLGSFDNELEAAHAYDEAAKLHFGEFAAPNFAESRAQ